ncbi:accelerated cell death 11 [Raphanus sativus]|uniref:Accelerated cell death 11 n=1 Tax=Raphanus sativus TaxID=3726 RepID=A0A9W3BY78_RAPSA|nr:accelerated cell death 11 [Raphanus sativus]
METVADAFKGLAATVNSRNPQVAVSQFSDACSLFSGLFGILDTSFKFAKMDYVGKLNHLAVASRSISTLEEMIDKDIQAGCVKKYGSHTRNLLKVKQGLEMIKVFCEELLATEGDDSLKDAAIKAYNQVLFPHHQYNIQKACATGLNSLPSKSLVLLLLGEAEETINVHLQSYVTASTPVIAYLDKLFLSKNLGIDW